MYQKLRRRISTTAFEGNIAYQTKKKPLSGLVGKTVPMTTVAVKWATEITTS